MTFDAVVSSSLDRAVTTAVYAASCRREDVLIDDRLLEIAYGKYEGSTFADLKDDMFAFLRDPDHVSPPATVESIPSLMERTGRFYRISSPFRGKYPCRHPRRGDSGVDGPSDRPARQGRVGHAGGKLRALKTVYEDGRFTPAELYRPK
jgi:hypothetical protein